jgi:hypothetical protein
MDSSRNTMHLVRRAAALSLVLLAAAACQKTPNSSGQQPNSAPAENSTQNQTSQMQTNSQTSKALSALPQTQSAQVSVDPKIYLVGNITFHAANFVNKYIKITGYIIARENGYIIFSDEKIDTPNPHDLPVTGSGLDKILPLHKYVLSGQFVYGGLVASNNNPYHFEVFNITN